MYTSAIFMAQLFRSLFSWKWYSVNDVSGQGADGLLKLCKGTIRKSVQHLNMKRDGGRYLMNSHQCDFLVKRLVETQDTLADYEESLLHLDEKAVPVLQELHQALMNAERLVQSSCITTSEWLRAAIEQGDMNETFSNLLYDVQWHKSVLQKIVVDHFKEFSITIVEPALRHGEREPTLRDRLGLGSAMKEDERVLKARLRSVIPRLDDPTEKELANKLLQKMEAIEDHLSSASGEGSNQLPRDREAREHSIVVVKDLNSLGMVASSINLLFLHPQNLNYYGGTLLGRGSFGEVWESNLLGGKCAIKIFEQHHTASFHQEVAALQGLGHHPHIVRLLCYSENNEKCFLIMEKMDMDLFQFLQRRKDNAGTLSVVEAVVLMLQIAEGVRYIHSKHMAHRDLKLGNVLVNVEADPLRNSLSRACAVKIADFGLTKTKNASKTYADQSWNIGTPRYMAPEVIKAEGDPNRTRLNPMKADVYSFGIMCFEILTGENAFGNLGAVALKKQVKAVGRPNLPMECPEKLASLIQKCWDGDFCNRPDFGVICEELRDIKALLLQGNDQKSQTRDITIESVQPEPKVHRRNFQATSGMSFSSLLFEPPIDLTSVPRVYWTSKRWNFMAVLVFTFLLVLLGVVSWYTKLHQVPTWEHSINIKKSDQFIDVDASMKSIKQGPWGRKEPNKLTGYFDHVADSIKSIELRYDQNPPRVGRMEVEYVKSNGEKFNGTYCWGVIGSKVVKMNFQFNEYIKQVSGSVALYFMEVEKMSIGPKEKIGIYSVVSLTIHTNLRSYGPFGDEVGEYSFRSGSGKVVGFFGVAGVLLDKLGVWIIPDGKDDGDSSRVIEQ